MVKITRLEPKTYQNKITGYKVELSDGVSGNLAEKDSDKGLKAGDDVTYIIADYVSKQGNHSNLLTIKRAVGTTTPTTFTPTPSTTPPPSGVPLPTKTPLSVNTKIDHKVQAAIKAMEFCMDTFTAEKIEWDAVLAKQKEVVATLWSEIDAIYSEK